MLPPLLFMLFASAPVGVFATDLGLSDGSALKEATAIRTETFTTADGAKVVRHITTSDLHNVSMGTYSQNGQVYNFRQEILPNGDSRYTFRTNDGKTITSVCAYGSECTGEGAAMSNNMQVNAPYALFVTEEVPGAQCTCAQGANCNQVETRKYQCIVDPGV